MKWTKAKKLTLFIRILFKLMALQGIQLLSLAFFQTSITVHLMEHRRSYDSKSKILVK